MHESLLSPSNEQYQRCQPPVIDEVHLVGAVVPLLFFSELTTLAMLDLSIPKAHPGERCGRVHC